MKERAVGLVFEQVKDNEPTWPIIVSVTAKIGCTVETLLGWRSGQGETNDHLDGSGHPDPGSGT